MHHAFGQAIGRPGVDIFGPGVHVPSSRLGILYFFGVL